MSLFDLYLVGLIACGVFLGNLIYDAIKSAVKKMMR